MSNYIVAYSFIISLDEMLNKRVDDVIKDINASSRQTDKSIHKQANVQEMFQTTVNEELSEVKNELKETKKQLNRIEALLKSVLERES